MDRFTCTICKKERPDDLHDSGKKKARCKICESHRKHLAKAKNPFEFGAFEAKYLDNRYLDYLGEKRCSICAAAKPKSSKWHKATCWSCHLKKSKEWKRKNRRTADRLDEYRRYNAARGCKTYGSREAMQKAKSAGCVRNSNGMQISFLAGDPDIEGCMTRLSRINAIERFSAYIKFDASDGWVEKFYSAKGKPWNNPRLSESEKWRLRYRLDKQFAVRCRIRVQHRKISKKTGIGDIVRSAICRDGESPTVQRLLGYTISELCRHLERQFTHGMNWDAFMSGKVHIDHIIPQAAFDLSQPSEWRACWSLTNLRPQWGKENRAKRDKIESLL